MIFSYTEEYSLYQTIQTEDLISPKTKLKDVLQLELYKRQITTLGAVRIHKKPKIRLIDLSTKEEIKKKYWTQEVKNFIEDNKRKYLVPNAGTKLNLIGKILIAISIIGIVSAAAFITKAIVFDTKTVEKRKEVFFSLPKKGDSYYGTVIWEKEDNKRIYGYTWSKIIEADSISKIYKIQLAVKNLSGTQRSFEPLSLDHSSYQGPIFQVNFKKLEDQNSVLFITDDKRFRFESGPLNIDYEKYKIISSK